MPLRGRALLVALYDAAVAGVAPGPLTTAALRSKALSGRTHLLALGKASHAMASAAAQYILRHEGIVAGGTIVAADDAAAPHPALMIRVGDHPIPGPRSFAAAAQLRESIAQLRRGDRALVLLSGGATSLLAAPVGNLAGADLSRLFDLLHRSGLDIHSMNVVRKRFIRWGAGRLAAALTSSASTTVLIVSDVPGDDPADVASGPCTPDAATADDVAMLLDDCGLLAGLPSPLRDYLDDVRRGRLPETPKRGDAAFAHVRTEVIGTNALAVDAAVGRGRALGLTAERGQPALAGEAAQCGDALAAMLVERAASGWRGCIVWGGETTVRRTDLLGDPEHGSGGRCQELALAAARRLARSNEHGRRVILLAAGTDGRDGPTDAAGAFADAQVWEAAARSGHDVEQALTLHRSYDALDAAGALLRVPPTGTNVMDVVIGVVE